MNQINSRKIVEIKKYNFLSVRFFSFARQMNQINNNNKIKIQNGELARDFTTNDIYGNTLKLSDLKVTKTILSFYRNVNTYFTSNAFKTMNDAKKLGLPAEKDKDASVNLIPADFLINKYLFIEKAHYGKHINDHIPISDIKEFAAY